MKRRARYCIGAFITVATILSAAVGELIEPAAAAAPMPATPAAVAPPRIPLCAGLTIVTAVSQQEGDYESIKRVESLSHDVARIRYSSEALVTDELSDEPPHIVHSTVYRSVRLTDLATSTQYEQQFFDALPEVIPGTTAIGTSTAVLQQLKSKGESDLSIFVAFSGAPTLTPGDVFYIFNNKMDSTVKRVGRDPVTLPVIVNDVPTRLPAIQVRGDFQGDLTEFYFLDDPANPITLKYRYGIGALNHVEGDRIAPGSATGRMDRDVLQVTKITTHCEGGAPDQDAGALEQSLQKTGKAIVYDIYFNFNSATLKPESEPSLREISAALQHHPDWKLDVAGHTDSVGGDKYNLTLSQQRAAAVKAALTARYHIDAQRLTTSGYGASRPQDTNATLEGRARNRRVELTRE